MTRPFRFRIPIDVDAHPIGQARQLVFHATNALRAIGLLIPLLDEEDAERIESLTCAMNEAVRKKLHALTSQPFPKDLR